MKGLKFIASILVASMLIGCGTPPKTEEEVDVTALQNDNQFNYVLAGFLQEYSEARLDFAIIFSVDVESIGLEEWKKLIDENQEQWEKVEFYGGLLTDYLTEKEAWIKTAHAHEGADLNELVEHGLVDPSVIDETYEEPDFGEGDHLMVDVEKDMDSGVGSGELGFYEEVLMVANDAEKGRILKDIVEKMGAFDAKMAQEWLEEANKLYVEQEAKNEIKYEKFEKLSEKVRNSAIFAGLAGFTIGGLYITGAGLLGASGTAGVGHMLTSAGFSIGTMEFLLSFGEHGAYLLDNREGQEYFATQQEEMNKFFKEAKFVISVKNLLTGKLPNAKDFSVEDIPDFIDNVKFVVGLNKAIESPIPEEMAKKLKEIEENRINQLEKLLPPGGYLYEETPVEEIEVEELPEAEELVEGPTVESLRIGHYETPYEIDDILTKQTGGGKLIFDVAEDGTVNGSVSFDHSGTTTHPGGYTSNLSSYFNGGISGTFNVETQRLEMNGTFSGVATAITEGIETSDPTNGDITITAVFSNGKFVGTMTIMSTIGSGGITNWEASAQ